MSEKTHGKQHSGVRPGLNHTNLPLYHVCSVLFRRGSPGISPPKDQFPPKTLEKIIMLLLNPTEVPNNK